MNSYSFRLAVSTISITRTEQVAITKRVSRRTGLAPVLKAVDENTFELIFKTSRVNAAKVFEALTYSIAPSTLLDLNLILTHDSDDTALASQRIVAGVHETNDHFPIIHYFEWPTYYIPSTAKVAS